MLSGLYMVSGTCDLKIVQSGGTGTSLPHHLAVKNHLWNFCKNLRVIHLPVRAVLTSELCTFNQMMQDLYAMEEVGIHEAAGVGSSVSDAADPFGGTTNADTLFYVFQTSQALAESPCPSAPKRARYEEGAVGDREDSEAQQPGINESTGKGKEKETALEEEAMAGGSEGTPSFEELFARFLQHPYVKLIYF